MMPPVLLLQCVALLLLLVCSAFFSNCETVYFSLTPLQIHRIRNRNPRAADRIQRLLLGPTKILSTILIGNTLVNVVAAAIGYVVAERFFPNHGEIVAIPAMTLMLLLFGELTPKRAAVAHAEKMAEIYSSFLPQLITVFTPLRAGVEWVVGLFRKDLHAPDRALSEDELISVIEAGEQQGVLNAEERAMVDGIISLDERQVTEVMTPRVDLAGIDLDDPPDKWVRTAMQSQFRYLILYRRSKDHIEGFIDAPKFLLAPDFNLESARVEPFFVPDTISLAELLNLFRREQRRAAIVSDEYGGTAGLVTIGDILEEIVGDIQSGIGVEKLTIQKMSEQRWIVDGSLSLEEINSGLDTRLEAEDVDRIAGWMSARLGHIPRTGEVVEAQGCRVTVHRTRRNRVVTVILEKLPDPETETGMEMGDETGLEGEGENL
jgi:putative hemolysin